MNPTGLPELFKPTRDQNKKQKCEKKEVLKFKMFEKTETIIKV